MNDHAWDLMLEDPERAGSVAKEAERLSRAIGYQAGLATSLLNRGWTASYLTNYDEAFRFLESAEEIFRDAGDDEGVAKTINARGVAFHNQSEYGRALKTYQRGLAYAENAGLSFRAVSVLNNIGELYLEIKRAENAEEYFLRALELIVDGTGTDILSEAIERGVGPDQEEACAAVVGNLGSIELTRGNFDRAEECFQYSLALAKNNKNRIVESEMLTHLGVLAQERGEHTLAEQYHTESLRISHASQNTLSSTSTLIHLGGLNERLGQVDGALGLYQQALEAAVVIGSPYFESRACSRIAELLERMEQWRDALTYHKRFARIRLALLSQSSEQKLQAMTEKIETERLQIVNERLQLINDFAQEITATLDLEEIFERVYQNINEIIDATVVGIALYDEQSNTIDFRLLMEDGVRLEPIRVDADRTDSFAAWVIRERREIHINDRDAQASFYLSREPDRWVGEKSSSLVFLPLVIKNRPVGLLTVQSRKPNAYTDLDMQVIHAVSSFVTIALDNAVVVDRINLRNQLVRREKDELEGAFKQISFLANHDHLTGLANRRMLVKMLELTISRVKENGESAGVLFLDLDRFKPVNDELGHDAGDEVLRIVSKRVRAALRHDDLAARMGGDEFVAIVKSVPSRKVVLAIAEKILSGIAKPMNVLGKTVSVSASLGIALYPDDGTTPDELIRCADDEMYRHKNRTAG